MNTARKSYPSDVSDEEWALVAPYLALLPEEAGQRDHPLREVFNGLRYIIKTGAPWRWMPNDLPPWASEHASDCLACQAICASSFRTLRAFAFSRTMSLRASAVRTSFLGLPAAHNF